MRASIGGVRVVRSRRPGRWRTGIGSGAAAAMALCLAGAGVPAAAQSMAPEEPPAKRITAAWMDPGSVRVDGSLDEEVWARATFHSDFLQKGKDRGFEPRLATEVALLYDGEALYVGARMEIEPCQAPWGVVSGRDDVGNSERILVALDTYLDRTTAYTFGVTVAGVRVDYKAGRDREGSRDDSFDPTWTARVAHGSTSWTAEMRIPFSQLRFSPGGEQTWGLNVRRWNPATHLNVYWSMVPYDESGWVSRFGTLGGLDGLAGGPRLEVLPYVLGQATRLDAAHGGDPDAETGVRWGADAKVGLGPSFTLEATANPDFGQVEADPARVNLTAYETFFPERRPFFLEGRELFRGRGPNWFYSRRIGSLPPGGGRGLLENVTNARILGGAKLTGRLPSGLSVGGLAAVSDRERVPVPDDSLGVPVEVAPLTAFGVGRLQQEIGPGGAVGVIGTLVERLHDDGSGLASRLPRRALAGAVDGTMRVGGGLDYEVSGYVGGSHVSGTPEAVASVQRSSAHYLQRPDADHVGLDSTRTMLHGWTAGLGLAKIGGAHWLWNLDVSAISPGFDIGDAGTLPRADLLEARAGVSYGVRDSQGGVRNRRVGVSLANRWNFGGDLLLFSPSVFARVGLQNRWSTSVQAGMAAPVVSDELTRGGPLMGTPRSWWAEAQLSSANSNTFWWNIEGSGFRDEAGGWSAALSGGLAGTVWRRMEISAYAGGSFGDDTRQFVTSLEGGPEATFGQRYVFAALERKELFTRLRAKLAFAPDAVLTLYAEPFVSSGRAQHFGELVAARSGELRRYGDQQSWTERLDDGGWRVHEGEDHFDLGNLDFNVRSFRATGVFRWEWRGSTLFLIWQRGQWRFGDTPGSATPDALLDSLRDPGQDVVAVKVRVRLGG